MVTPAQLAPWIVAASVVTSSGQRKLTQRTAEAIAQEAIANPIAATDDGILRTASIVVALAWFEGANREDAVNPSRTDWCFGQINLPGGAKTAEGWTGPELAADPVKCAKVTIRIIKASLLASPACDLCGLVVYARGRDTPEGRRLSANRMGLARRILLAVPAP